MTLLSETQPDNKVIDIDFIQALVIIYKLLSKRNRGFHKG